MENELKIVSPSELRKAATKVVATSQGNFLIKKLVGGELVHAKMFGKLFKGMTGLTQTTMVEQMTKSVGDHIEDFVEIIITRCVVQPRISLDDNCPEDVVPVSSLELDTFLTLITEVLEFSNLSGGDTFRGSGSAEAD